MKVRYTELSSRHGKVVDLLPSAARRLLDAGIVTEVKNKTTDSSEAKPTPAKKTTAKKATASKPTDD